MKQISQFLKESVKVNKGSIFSERVKYTLSDWNKWKSEVSSVKDIEVYEDTEDGLFMVYMNEKHIATYLVKDQILMCDDTELFGHEEE